MQAKTGEIEFCDIEIQIDASAPHWEQTLVEALGRLGEPEGSKLIVESTGRERSFGVTEGLAIHLNGSDLPDEVYRNCDSSFVYSEFDCLLEGRGRVLSWWERPTETAFYVYGDSFESMRSQLDEFIRSYPLCQRARVVRVA